VGSYSHLDELNAAQRSAAEYGIDQSNGHPNCGPLLIIAGAGSGKTNTLAHRVAHLILNGADPQRILLLTFTRRAAAEMTRRAQRICIRSAANATQAASTEAGLLPWSGTFHGVGNRLLRMYATSIGLDPAFTVLDRSDAVDLMNLVRDDLGFSRKAARFPKKATCLDIYSSTLNAQRPVEDTLDIDYPWCREWVAELKQLFGGYVAASRRRTPSTTTTCCSIGGT